MNLNFNIKRIEINGSLRGNFTSRNLDFSKDVMHLSELGFREISVEPVVS